MPTYLLFAACFPVPPADLTPLLEQAEQMMNVRPDRLLTLLESMPEPEELSKKRQT